LNFGLAEVNACFDIALKIHEFDARAGPKENNSSGDPMFKIDIDIQNIGRNKHQNAC
jgi:hypothetical protein